MVESNVLFGNGVNIEFSGNDDYKNWSILKRMDTNLAQQGRYNDIFAGKVDDMQGFLDGLNYWFKNKALKGIEAFQWVENKDDLRAIWIV